MILHQFFKPCIIGALVLLVIFGLVCAYFGFAAQGTDEAAECTPQEGEWYCTELQMQLSFSDQGQSTVIIDGNTISCTWENDIGSHDIYVLCQEVDHPSYKLGELLFWFKYVSLDDGTYVVSDHESGELCYFIKIQ